MSGQARDSPAPKAATLRAGPNYYRDNTNAGPAPHRVASKDCCKYESGAVSETA